jgi:hypothetical protein
VKFNLNPCQHDFTESKSTINNLVPYPGFLSRLLVSRGQADAICFHRGNFFLTRRFFIREILFVFLVVLLTRFAVAYQVDNPSSVFLNSWIALRCFYKDLFRGLCFSAGSLMTYVIQLTTQDILLLLMTYKSTVPLTLLKSAVYYSLILIL